MDLRYTRRSSAASNRSGSRPIRESGASPVASIFVRSKPRPAGTQACTRRSGQVKGKPNAAVPLAPIASLFEPQKLEGAANKSYLSMPYSPKARRRLQLSTPKLYALWVRVECDGSITIFNERPAKLTLALAPGIAAQFAPGMVTSDINKAVTIHTFNGALEDEEEDEAPEAAIAEVDRALRKVAANEEVGDARALAVARAKLMSRAWAQWCEEHSYAHRDWTPIELYEPRLRLQNLDRLLRLTTRPGRPSREDLSRQLIAELRTERRMTVWALSQRFVSQDPADVMAQIASLIISGSVFSDIDTHPWTYASELSAFSPLVAKF